MTDFTTDTCIYIDWDYFGDSVVYSEPGATCNHPDFVGATYGGTVSELSTSPLMYNYRAEGECTYLLLHRKRHSEGNGFGLCPFGLSKFELEYL